MGPTKPVSPRLSTSAEPRTTSRNALSSALGSAVGGCLTRANGTAGPSTPIARGESSCPSACAPATIRRPVQVPARRLAACQKSPTVDRAPPAPAARPGRLAARSRTARPICPESGDPRRPRNPTASFRAACTSLTSRFKLLPNEGVPCADQGPATSPQDPSLHSAVLPEAAS